VIRILSSDRILGVESSKSVTPIFTHRAHQQGFEDDPDVLMDEKTLQFVSDAPPTGSECKTGSITAMMRTSQFDHKFIVHLQPLVTCTLQP